jgi:SAM-dependent methyltransferase
MYRQLAGAVPALVPANSRLALSVSGSGFLAGLVAPQAKVVDASYPEFNILSLPYDDNTFDLVVTDQVLEHVQGDPFAAVEECRRVLKPGGISIHTTPFLFQIHGYPSDFWRFTPDALALLCGTHSEVLLTGSWGNRFLWLLSWAGVLFDQHVPLAKWHPYHKIAVIDEPKFPVVCWVVARK